MSPNRFKSASRVVATGAETAAYRFAIVFLNQLMSLYSKYFFSQPASIYSFAAYFFDDVMTHNAHDYVVTSQLFWRPKKQQFLVRIASRGKTVLIFTPLCYYSYDFVLYDSNHVIHNYKTFYVFG